MKVWEVHGSDDRYEGVYGISNDLHLTRERAIHAVADWAQARQYTLGEWTQLVCGDPTVIQAVVRGRYGSFHFQIKEREVH